MASELKILISATDKASRTLKGVQKGVTDLGGASKTLGTVAKVSAAALLGVAAAVGVVSAAVAKLAIDAAPLENIEAAFDALAESAGRAGEEVLAGMQEASGGMITARDLMLSFNKAAQLVSPQFALDITEALGPMQKLAASTGDSMDYLMNSLVVGVGRLSPMWLDNLAVTMDANTVYEEFAKTLGVAASELTKTQKQSAIFAETLRQMKKNTEMMPDITDTAAAAWARLTTQLKDLKDQVGLLLVPILETLLPTLQQALTSITPVLKGIASALAAAFGSDLVQSGLKAFGDFMERIARVFDMLKHGESLLDSLFAVFGQMIPPGMRDEAVAMMGALRELQNVILEHAPVFIDMIKQIGGALFEAFSTNLPAMIDLITSAIKTFAAFWAELGDEIIMIVGTVFKFLTVIIGSSLRFIVGMLTSFFKLLTGDWEGAYTEIIDMTGDVLSLIGELFGEAGKAIIDGMIEGLNENKDRLLDIVDLLGKDALKTMNLALGISSPSKVFEGVGKYMMQGLASGISGSAGLPTQALQSVSHQTTDASMNVYGPVSVTAPSDGSMLGLLEQLKIAAEATT